jgi:putative nucleotidyltransferase with HDIG domain
MLELRDQETEGHSRRVTAMTMELAMAYGIHGENLDNVRRGALLHDIGKIGVPDSILLKAGTLDDGERAIIRQHPSYAQRAMSGIPFLKKAVDIPYCHHERWDGNGYPRGLSGTSIPLSARLFAVVDVWDALRSDRPYRASMGTEEAFAIIASGAGSQFDPDVVALFLELRKAEILGSYGSAPERSYSRPKVNRAARPARVRL